MLLTNDKKSADPKDIFLSVISNSNKFFRNKDALLLSYMPRKILYRDEEILQISKALSPLLIGNMPTNLFIFGFTGTGKSLVTKKVVSDLIEVAKQNNLPIFSVYLNCKLENINSEYRLISSIAKIFGAKLPETGLSLSKIYEIMINIIKDFDARKNKHIVVVLDEIDYLLLKGEGFLYNFSRINEKEKDVSFSVIGISNVLNLKERLNPRVLSSLNPKEIIFKPYTAPEIEGIIRDRAEEAFYPDALEEGVIQKVAAISAQEHGDVRKALNLLLSAGEIAQREGDNKIKLDHIDKAYEETEKNVLEEVVKSLTPQAKLVFLAILQLIKKKKSDKIYSGEVYDTYVRLADNYGMRKLTFRRVADLISELDYNSLISLKLKNNGRYGRTREVSLGFSLQIIPILENILNNSLSPNYG
jgi:cell division control protein 6